MALTDTAIKRLRPSEKCTAKRPDKHSDGHGLQLWVRQLAQRFFTRHIAMMANKNKYNLVSTLCYHSKKRERKTKPLKKLLARNIDPKEHRQQLKYEQDSKNTFGVIAEEWHKEQSEHLAKGTHSRNYSMYQRDIAPFITNKLPDDINPQDILAIGKRIEERGATDMARRAIRQTGQIFKHAMILGKATKNPSTGLTEALKPRKTTNYAKVTHKDLPKLLQDIHAYTGDPLVKYGLLMVSYMFVRTKELRLMQWQHIDLTEKVWRIPADIMKMDRPHICRCLLK